MDGHDIDAYSTDRCREVDCIRGFKIANRPESIGMIAAIFECTPCRHDPAAKGDKHAFFRIGRVCSQMDGGRQIGWTIRIGVIGSELRAGEDHRLGKMALKMHEQRRFFHGVSAMQHDNAIDFRVCDLRFNSIADGLHVDQRQAG